MTRIHVLHGWRGDTAQVILKGDYDAEDPRLFGKADYLVANRHAEVIEDDEAEVVKPTLDDLTVKQLKEMAVEMKLDITSAKTKADFIKLIKAASGEAEDEDDTDEPESEGSEGKGAK